VTQVSDAPGVVEGGVDVVVGAVVLAGVDVLAGVVVLAGVDVVAGVEVVVGAAVVGGVGGGLTRDPEAVATGGKSSALMVLMAPIGSKSCSTAVQLSKSAHLCMTQ